MEAVLMTCALLAIIILLFGYRRATRQENRPGASWLFAYRVDRDDEATRSRTARK